MRVHALLALALLPLAGCVSDAPLDAASAGDASLAPSSLSGPVLLAEYAWAGSGGYEFSTCGMGEGPPLKRLALVPNGTRAFRVTVEAGATTALRAGWALDDAEPSWTEVVPAGASRAFDVPVDDSGWEVGAERWTFLYQPNLPAPLTQDCYTGASVGGLRVAFEAVP